MKKRIRLKLGGKVLLSIVILAIDLFIYLKTGMLGKLAQHNKFYLILCIMSWGWLFIGQIIALAKIWED